MTVQAAPPWTARLARFAAGASAAAFPPRARALAVDAITDGVACALAGTAEPLVGPLLACVATPPEGPAALLGLGRRAAPPDSALVNGTLMHALDYDDTNHPGYAHPTAAILPALLAAAALRPEATGAELVTGYIVGIEVVGKLGAALNTAHYKRGWHATSTFGSLAAAAAAASLLRLDEAEAAVALAIAASSASGLRANFGTMTKPLHAGLAARNGILAAMLARVGWSANPAALEHPAGYVAAFNGDAKVRPAPLARWGEALEILSDYGIALKPYPSCGATHTAIEAAILLRAEIGDPARIRRIRCGVSEMHARPLIYVEAASGLQGKFSLHYCVAAALLDGVVDLATFRDARVHDPRIQALVPRIAMEVDERVRHDPEFACVLEVELQDGARHERLVPLAMGKPARWFDAARLGAKLADCLRHAAPQATPAEAAALFARLQAIDGPQPAHSLAEGLPGAAQ
jgi:2-methylcitrate dehydratase PrpD